MDLKITPARLAGRVEIPPSKSYGHRAVICAGLAGSSTVSGLGRSEDIDATVLAMNALGAYGGVRDDKYTSKSFRNVNTARIDCRESGSTLRFMIPLALAFSGNTEFYGSKRLFERPLTPYFDIFAKQGINYVLSEGRLLVSGRLQSGEFAVKGNISSQFITGLLFALPLLDGDSVIEIEGNLESKPYVDLTIETLEKYGIIIDNQAYERFIVRGGQKYKKADFRVEADFSQAAFFLSANALGGEVDCVNLPQESLQGDREIIRLLEQFTRNGSVTAIESIDVSDIPDLVPILAVVASFAAGETRIVNAGRLRLKESDRLEAITQELQALGADIRISNDTLVINGKKTLQGGNCNSHNDHRIAMSLAICSQRCEEPIFLSNAECVEKSMPDFWRKFESLGGKLHELSMG